MVEPNINATAFACPHCGAYTTQIWHNAYLAQIKGEEPVPTFPAADFEESVRAAKEIDQDTKRAWLQWAQRMRQREPFCSVEVEYLRLNQLHNLFFSHCYNCKRWAAWVSDSLVYPPKRSGPSPSPDLPVEVCRVVEEARSIVDLSPRGACALLRLSIQLLCAHLGETTKDLNDAIGNLVKKGLSPLVQKSLDVVRVIGNEAIHPGVIDLADDRDTATSLFRLVNLIAEQLITTPKHVTAMYERLPETKRIGIQKRDSQTKQPLK